MLQFIFVQNLQREGKFLNSFLPSSHFSHHRITFANSLDPDQDQKNVSPDLDPNCLTPIVFLTFFLNPKFRGLHYKSVAFKGQKEKSAARITVCHHKSCRVLTIGDPVGQIFFLLTRLGFPLFYPFEQILSHTP